MFKESKERPAAISICVADAFILTSRSVENIQSMNWQTRSEELLATREALLGESPSRFTPATHIIIMDRVGRAAASGSASPGAERHRALIRAPVTSVGHFEQILVPLKGFFGRLDPVEDQVVVDDFLSAREERGRISGQPIRTSAQSHLLFAPTVTLIFFFFSSSMYSICFLKASRSWFSMVLATRT